MIQYRIAKKAVTQISFLIQMIFLVALDLTSQTSRKRAILALMMTIKSKILKKVQVY